MTNVICFYDGESTLTGERILGFLYTGRSQNEKIGSNTAYTVYVPAELPPGETKTRTEAVCGRCPIKSKCYVKWYMDRTYRQWIAKYHAGQVEFKDMTEKENRQWLFFQSFSLLRFGMSGDPASIPFSSTEPLVDAMGIENTIGYSHQFSHEGFDPQYSDILMRSTETWDNSKQPTALIISSFSDKPHGFISCPAQRYKKGEIKKKVTCADCRLCSPSRNVNVAFEPEGAPNIKKSFEKWLKRT